MEYITLQAAVWRKLNCTSTKKHTRAHAKLFTLSLCEIMEDRWNKFSTLYDSIKKLETDLYYTKNPQKEVIAIPIDKAILFVDKYTIRAHKKYIDNMNKCFDEIFVKNPDMKRLSDEELEKIKNEESESEHESDMSEADEGEY